MAQIFTYFPGQKVTIFLETMDSNKVRTDTITAPVIQRIILPDLTLSANYPQNMSKFDTGLYYHQFILPLGASAVGTYLFDVVFTHPSTGAINNKVYQIVVTAPYGSFGVTTSA